MKHSTTAETLSCGPVDPELHPLVWRWVLGLPLPATSRPRRSPYARHARRARSGPVDLPSPDALLEAPPGAPAERPSFPDPVEPAPEEPSVLEAPVPAPAQPEVIPMEAPPTTPDATDPQEETEPETELPRCTVPGCEGTRARVRQDTDPSIRPWCAPCRVTVRQRALRQGLPQRVVAKKYLAERRGEPEAPATSKPAQTSKPASKPAKPRSAPREAAERSTPDLLQPETADACVRPMAVVPHHTPDGVLRVITSTVDVELPAELVRLQELAARAGGIERLDALVSAALALGGRP